MKDVTECNEIYNSYFNKWIAVKDNAPAEHEYILKPDIWIALTYCEDNGIRLDLPGGVEAITAAVNDLTAKGEIDMLNAIAATLEMLEKMKKDLL